MYRPAYYVAGAMLMAMYIQGLNNQETIDLTRAMVCSGMDSFSRFLTILSA